MAEWFSENWINSLLDPFYTGRQLMSGMVGTAEQINQWSQDAHDWLWGTKKVEDLPIELKKQHARSVLLAEAALLGVAAGVPTILALYALKSKKKPLTAKETAMVEIAEGSANRATSLVAATLPVLGLPIGYITVQMLEEAGYIKSGLGNTVQSLMTAGVVLPAIAQITGSVLGTMSKGGRFAGK